MYSLAFSCPISWMKKNTNTHTAVRYKSFLTLLYPAWGWREVLTCPCRRRVSFRGRGQEFYFPGLFFWLVHSNEGKSFCLFDWIVDNLKVFSIGGLRGFVDWFCGTESMHKFTEYSKLDDWFVLKSNRLENTLELSDYEALSGDKLMWMSSSIVHLNLVVFEGAGVLS